MQDSDNAPETAPETDAPGLAAFESSIAELETLVETLESGDVALEDALARFERGITLARQCQTMLKTAELRVDQLLGDDENARVGPLDTHDLDAPGESTQ